MGQVEEGVSRGTGAAHRGEGVGVRAGVIPGSPETGRRASLTGMGACWTGTVPPVTRDVSRPPGRGRLIGVPGYDESRCWWDVTGPGWVVRTARGGGAAGGFAGGILATDPGRG